MSSADLPRDDAPPGPVTTGLPTAASAPAPRPRDARIDMLKGLAIVGVLLTHALTFRQYRSIHADLYIGQAVPLFLLLFGMNLAESLKRRGGMAVYVRRARRLALPFVAVFFVAWAFAIVRWAVRGKVPVVHPLSLLGMLPVPSPGNYFVAVMAVALAAGPLLYRLYRRAPRTTIALTALVVVAFEVVALMDPMARRLTVFYDYAFVRFLGAIAIGFWLADGPGLFAKRNRWLWVVAAVSTAYLMAHTFLGFRIGLFDLRWQPLNIVAVGYPALLAMIGIQYLPRTPGALGSVLAELGRASWHIFLVQMLYFGLVPPALLPLPLDVALPLVAGWAFYLAERRASARASGCATAAFGTSVD